MIRAAAHEAVDCSADDNARVANMLREAATLLAVQKGNSLRVAASRKAAETVAGLPSRVQRLFEIQGRAGLDTLPSLAADSAKVPDVFHALSRRNRGDPC
jgi:hypothetical protein